MNIRTTSGDIAQIKADAIIMPVFAETKKRDSDLAGMDKALDGALSPLISQGEVKGKLNELTTVHTMGKLPAARVILLGLGKEKELTAEKVRGAIGEASRLRSEEHTSELQSRLHL